MRNNTPLIYDLFTGGKTPELAIFFNLAYDNLEKYVKSIDSEVKVFSNSDGLPDKVFTYLREYIWKGNSQNKNSEGHAVTEDEKAIIAEMIRKVKGFRNFHSHIWHNHDVLKCTEVLRKFILNLHDSAVAKISASISKNGKLYIEQRKEYPFFKQHSNESYVTQEGRLYFLSFFLNRGEMQLLLSQSKGSKQNNLPEYKFKHEVFTYYCHREGSSWDSSGIKNEGLEKMDAQQRKRILKGRQAFKIMNYLNDEPVFEYQEDGLPLLYECNGEVKAVENSAELLHYIKGKQILQKLEFNIPDWLSEATDPVVKDESERNEYQKQVELKQREGWVEMLYDKQPWIFEIGFNTLKHIVTAIQVGKIISYTKEDGTPEYETAEVHFIRVLEDCIKTRNYFYTQLKEAGEEPLNKDNFRLKKLFTSVFIKYEQYSDITDTVNYEPDQLRSIPILSTPKVEKKLIEWHQSFTLGKKNEITKRKQLLNLIRPANKKFDSSLYIGKLKNGKAKIIPVNQKPEPLLFHLAYFYKEQNQKTRRYDMFMEWAAKYIIDYNIAPDWYWETEKYIYEKRTNKENSDMKLKKELFYTQQIPENYRIRVIDNCITVGLPKIGNPKNSKDFYKFRLNQRALTFLLLQVLTGQTNNEKNTNHFLLTIREDVERLYNDAGDNLQLLEDFAIPGYLKSMQAKAKPSSIKEELKKFIDGKIKWIDDNLAARDKLSRNNKNRIILEVYKLFDFSETAGAKFLRKSEYEQMSICHFMLNQNPTKVLPLLRVVFGIENRLPVDIRRLIYESKDLNELFESVLENRKRYLKEILKNQVEAELPSKFLRALAAYFNIKLPTALLTASAAEKRVELRNENKEHIPFIISPILVLKYYYREEFVAGGFTPNPNPGSRPYRNVLKEYRDSNFRNLLIKEYYDTQKLEQLLPGSLIERMPPAAVSHFTAIKRKMIGLILETQTKDLLLFQMCEQYLKDYDKLLFENIKKQQSLETLKLSNLFKEKVIVELKRSDGGTESDYTEIEIKRMPESIYLSLQMHQVDDYFFRSQHDKLYRLALHYVQRRHEELELYKDRRVIIEKVEAWQDGSFERPVLMSDLINERKICAGYGKELMQYILDYERLVLHDYCMERIGVLKTEQESEVMKNKKQQVLEGFAEENKKNLNSRKYIPFKMLPKLTNAPEIFYAIKSLRNQCQHSAIPLNGSFRKLSMPGSLVGDALHITQMLGRDRSAENPYEQDGENEVA